MEVKMSKMAIFSIFTDFHGVWGKMLARGGRTPVLSASARHFAHYFPRLPGLQLFGQFVPHNVNIDLGLLLHFLQQTLGRRAHPRLSEKANKRFSSSLFFHFRRGMRGGIFPI